MADKVKEVAIEEADRVRNLAADAAKSGAFLYPLKVRLDHSSSVHSNKICILT